jgi:hypothetical protein
MKKLLVLLAFVSPVYADNLCVNLNQFTQEEIQTGEKYFNSTCGQCHQYNLTGRKAGNAANEYPSFTNFPQSYLDFLDGSGGNVPPLIGESWMSKFKSFPEFVIYAPSAASTPMFYPTAAPKRGADWPQTYLRLAAYILYKNCERK